MSTDLATAERAAICTAFAEAGPDRPTLCGDWTTRVLLAHLLVREREPWTVPGIMVAPLAWLTEKAMRAYDRVPFDEMVATLAAGPPLWSPFRIGVVDRFANAAEFFVHHEDVRRGVPGWAPRNLGAQRAEQLWGVLSRMARLLYRRSPVGVTLRTAAGRELVACRGGGITVVGEPGELVLHAFGRDTVEVEVVGEPDDVSRFVAVPRAF